MKDTFEQKIRLAALEDQGEDTALVKISDLVELLNSRDSARSEMDRLGFHVKNLEARCNDLLGQLLRMKPCKCSKYIDLRG